MSHDFLPLGIIVYADVGQSGALFKNYLKYPDRAVALCRVYIDRMFGNRSGLISVN